MTYGVHEKHLQPYVMVLHTMNNFVATTMNSVERNCQKKPSIFLHIINLRTVLY